MECATVKDVTMIGFQSHDGLNDGGAGKANIVLFHLQGKPYRGCVFEKSSMFSSAR
jgi:hypothetical protein